jgi:hypothetical protein
VLLLLLLLLGVLVVETGLLYCWWQQGQKGWEGQL